MAEKKRLGAGPRHETAMSCIQTYLFVLEVDVVRLSCFESVGVEDVRSNLLAVHVDTAAELHGGAGLHPGDRQHPPPVSSSLLPQGEVVFAPLNLTFLSRSESNHFACKIQLLSRAGNMIHGQTLLHKAKISNLRRMIYSQRSVVDQ